MSGLECLGRAAVSHSADDVKEFDELWQSAEEVALLPPPPLLALFLLFLSRPFPPEPSQNTSRPYCYHQRVAMTTEAGTGEGRLRMQQVNAKALIYTCSHMITVDDASFMNL